MLYLLREKGTELKDGSLHEEMEDAAVHGGGGDSRRGKGLRRRLCAGAALLFLGTLLVFAADLRVKKCSAYVFSRPDQVPFREYALLLGTARVVQGKYLNAYFTGRIRAAVELYRAGKVRKIIVSGDNRRKGYNEPRDMKEALMAEGIPEGDILMDFAGFRTLDSVIRARNVFGAAEFTVVSQRFHCERAVFLARANGLPAIGFAAAEVPRRFRFKNALREPLARFKACLDLYLLRTRPHFEK